MSKYIKGGSALLLLAVVPFVLVYAAGPNANASAYAHGAGGSVASANCIGTVSGYTGTPGLDAGVTLEAWDDHSNYLSNSGYKMCEGNSFCQKSVTDTTLPWYSLEEVFATCSVTAWDDVGFDTDYDTDSDY